MGNSLQGFNSRVEQVEERITKHEDESMEIIQYKKQEKKKGSKMNRASETYRTP